MHEKGDRGGVLFSSSPLARASEGRRPESESKSLICEPPPGEAFEYTRGRLAPPFPANRIEFTQAGFFGCTSVSCTGFFMMAVSPQGFALVANQRFAPLSLPLRATRDHTRPYPSRTGFTPTPRNSYFTFTLCTDLPDIHHIFVRKE